MRAAALIIAVDGPAASGKGTLAKRLGNAYHLPVLDTGLLYRAVGQKMQDDAFELADEAAATRLAQQFDAAWLDDPRLRAREAGEAASRVAAFLPVRAALLHFQQEFAHQPSGAVLDGRDIGTVIAPEAPIKFWIDAEVNIRANRRFSELCARGEDVREADILADLIARDKRDAPNMRIAPDALRIDTTTLNADAVFEAAMAYIKSR